ncbi:MAG: VOC family protein [Bacteroidia bacterium]
MKKGKITGIGGIFFKCDDPDKMREWYGATFGFETDEYGAMFKSKDFEKPEKTNYLQWSTMSRNSKYFAPSKSQFMVNYRVENIEALVEQLKSDGVEVVDEIEEFDYGKFVHVLDPEGNKVELWEPIDEAFD